MGWLVYVLVPVVAALTGCAATATTRLAFRPAPLVGLVPRGTARLVRSSAALLGGLVEPREIFGRLDPDIVGQKIEKPLLLAVDDVAREVMERHHPSLWEMLPTLAQDMIIKQVQAGAPTMARRIIEELRDNIDHVLDVRHLVRSTLEREPEVLVRLYRDISRPDTRFMVACGVCCGLLVGLAQAVVWDVTGQPVTLPLLGAVLGAVAVWSAIALLFFPRDPTTVLGRPVHGRFLRRREEVARQYGELVAREVLTVPNIVDGVLHGPRSDRLVAMIQRNVQRTIDEQASIAKPFVSVAIGPRRFLEMKQAAAERALGHVVGTLLHAHDYATSALRMSETIAARVRGLPRTEYEKLLRPALRPGQGELIAVGAVVGALVGALHALLLAT